MGIFDFWISKVKTSLGYQQSFIDCVEAGNIADALGMMCNDSTEQQNAYKEYKTDSHPIMQRADKAIYDNDGKFKGGLNAGSCLYHTLSILTRLHWCLSMADLHCGCSAALIRITHIRLFVIFWRISISIAE